MTRGNHVRFVIKICGITNEEDARIAIEAGANALGFNFYRKSPRYVAPDRARQIVARIPGEYLKVGVFVNPSEDEIRAAADVAPLEIVQVHGADPLQVIPSAGLPLWIAISPDLKIDVPSHDAYLIEPPSDAFGGAGQTFDWTRALGRNHRVIVAGGLHATNVAEAIATAQPWGVDACSRLEVRPGKKDAQRVRDFIATALLASESLRECRAI